MGKARKKKGRGVPGIIWRLDKEKHGPDDSTAGESKVRQASDEDPSFLGKLQLIAERAMAARVGRMREFL